MLAKITSCATVGLNSIPVEVEVDVTDQGLPSFSIVGLPDKAVEEAKERVKSAIKNSNFSFPGHHVIVNLAPADLPKEGTSFDLPIALGILLAHGQIPGDFVNSLVLGELSLDGSLRHTVGILPMALLAKEKNFKSVFLPQIDAKEAAIVDSINIYPIENLRQIFLHQNETQIIETFPYSPINLDLETDHEFDLKDIKGQEQAKRALEICASGGHNIILKGPPGAGKTLLARTLPSILPHMTMEEALETTKIYSVSGLLKNEEPLMVQRPFRNPHHTASHIGLVGGGQHPKPGEISLSHHGVLFMDEFPEFPRHVLEAMRQPLEDGFISVSRALGTIKFPSQFILVAAANPCPCGFFNSPDTKHHCTCSPGQIIRYQKRVSGPLMDRIDLYVEVPAVEVEKLANIDTSKIEDSKTVRKRVQNARDIQRERFKTGKISSNSQMKNPEIKEFCPLDSACLELLKKAVYQFGLSARGFQRTIKVARTIADLAGAKDINVNYLAEALQYRQKVDL